jgi:O-antigen ligase
MTEMSQPTYATAAAKVFGRDRVMLVCDWLAVALAASLPWSTSATGILVGLWLVALIPTLDVAALRREVLTPAGGFPVLLCALGVAGMLWADVSFKERWGGLDSFLKLLVIPLMLIHFRRSERGTWVMIGFLVSCSALLALSWALLLFPEIPWPKKYSVGVPVKDYVAQSAIFTVCIAILLDLALKAWRSARADIASACLLLAMAFLANIFFIAVSRTALLFLPVLLLLFGIRRFDWKGTLGLLAGFVVLIAAVWPFSEYLQHRVGSILQEVQIYRSENVRTSAGERLEFWRKSLGFIAEAPVIGHGTGTIREQFRRVATGEEGVSALIAANPHNQTLAVAIQLGLVGVAALFAMWIAHLLLFRGEGFAAWVGLVVVAQNIFGSLFNTHLFDFTHGWGYVIGVGVAGGIVSAARSRKPQPAATGTMEHEKAGRCD